MENSKIHYMAKLAKEYLAIPATSAKSERVMNTASRILSMKHASPDSNILLHQK
jgi:hypothetical protein